MEKHEHTLRGCWRTGALSNYIVWGVATEGSSLQIGQSKCSVQRGTERTRFARQGSLVRDKELWLGHRHAGLFIKQSTHTHKRKRANAAWMPCGRGCQSLTLIVFQIGFPASHRASLPHFGKGELANNRRLVTRHNSKA